MTQDSQVLGGLLGLVREVRIDGPVEFSVSSKNAFAIQGVRVERSTSFNRYFNGLKRVTLDTRTVRVWRVLNTNARVVAQQVFALFPDAGVRCVELAHVRTVLSRHVQGATSLLNGERPNIFCAKDCFGIDRVGYLGRMSASAWTLGAPAAVGGSFNFLCVPGTFVLTY